MFNHIDINDNDESEKNIKRIGKKYMSPDENILTNTKNDIKITDTPKFDNFKRSISEKIQDAIDKHESNFTYNKSIDIEYNNKHEILEDLR